MEDQNQQQTLSPQQPAIPPQNVNPVPPPQHKNWIKWVLIIVLVVLLVSITTYFVLTFQSQKPPPPQIVQTTPSPTPTPLPSKTPTPLPSEASATEGDQTANWRTYTNTEKNFSLKYPNDWSVKIFNESSFILGKKSDLEILTAEMLNHGWPGGMSIDITKTEYSSRELQKEGIEKSPWDENLNHYQFSKTTMGGKMANKTISLSPEDYIPFPYTSIGLNFKGHGWTVRFPNINYKGDHDKIYDQILSTFKFTQ